MKGEEILSLSNIMPMCRYHASNHYERRRHVERYCNRSVNVSYIAIVVKCICTYIYHLCSLSKKEKKKNLHILPRPHAYYSSNKA